MPMHDYGNGTLHADAFAPAVLYAVYAIAACVETADASLSNTLEDKTPPSAVFFEGKGLQSNISGRPNYIAELS